MPGVVFAMHPYLMPGLELSPLAFERLIRHISERRYDEKTDPNRFTLREAIAHLADWEPIFLHRIQAGVDNPGAEILGIDEGQRSVEEHYERWGVQESLKTFAKARSETIRYLKGLSADQWQTKVRHNEKGEMTAYDQANMLLGHDIYHFEHASQFLGPKTAGTW